MFRLLRTPQCWPMFLMLTTWNCFSQYKKR